MRPRRPRFAMQCLCIALLMFVSRIIYWIFAADHVGGTVELNAFIAGLQFTAHRSLQIWDIWDSIFGRRRYRREHQRHLLDSQVGLGSAEYAKQIPVGQRTRPSSARRSATALVHSPGTRAAKCAR